MNVITLITNSTGIAARMRTSRKRNIRLPGDPRFGDGDARQGAAGRERHAAATKTRALAAAAAPLHHALAARHARQLAGMQLRGPAACRPATYTRSRMMLSSAQLYMKIGAPGATLAKRLLTISAPGYTVRPSRVDVFRVDLLVLLGDRNPFGGDRSNR